MSKRKGDDVSFFDTAAAAGSVKKPRETRGPLPWIRYNTDTQAYEVNEEACAFLESLNGPLSVCSVVGNYRTGKSYLLNRICGGEADAGNFMVSGTTQSCTKGLWIMRRTLTADDGTNVLVVDTEGLGSMSASETHDLRVFSLALLLSSTFLYNSTGAITEATLSNLSLVSSLTEHVRVTADETCDEEALGECFPHFIYVARDFSLQLVGESGEEVDSTTYLNQSLRVRGDPESSKNKVRRAINKLFPQGKRSCTCMVRPCNNENDLQNLPGMHDEDLRPEFLQAIENIRRQIASTPPASHDGMSVTGPMLARLARLYVDAINGGAIPAIRDSWTLLSEGECRASMDAARAYFDNVHASQSKEISVVAARKVLRDALEEGLRMYDTKAVGPVASELRVALAADMEGRVRSALAEVQSRAATAMRERLSRVESEVSRESTSISDVIAAYETHKGNMVETCGEESLAVWWPEAFPSLCRSVHSFSFRAEKKRHELQVRVDTAELEISKAKAEAESESNRLKRDLETAVQKCSGFEERASAAERRVDDMQRQFDLQTSEHQSLVSSYEEKLTALRQEAAEAKTQQAHEATGASEEQTQQLAALNQQLTAAKVDLDERDDRIAAYERRATELEEHAASMEDIAKEAAGLRSELETAESRAAEFQATEKALRADLDSMQRLHDEESATVQQEALETVDAIKKVLQRERDRSKVEREKHDATLKSARDSAAERAASYEEKIRQMELATVEREAHVREAKRLSEQECTSLRGEIERFQQLFQQQRESQEANRREWLQQIQDMRSASSNAMTDHKDVLKEHQDARRELESKVATHKANNDALERRRKTLEEELARSRQMLSQSKNSGLEMARMSTELNALRDSKDRLESEARMCRSALEAAKKAEQDAKRSASSEITRMRMKYERQISVLESRLLD